jgi:pimeloyl-ACP methyl ester carboxylesterase
MFTTRILTLVGGICREFRPHGLLLALSVSLVLPLASAGVLLAQGEEEVQAPTPVELGGNDLVTKDGVQLSATFYPGTLGKESVPVILLHMSKGDRKEYAGLAPYLQQRGCAVLVPDLRGHGDSTTVLMGNTTRELDAAKMPSAQFTRMVNYDMETLKSFLLRKNNEKELNIEKLCVVGAEMGASVAIDWARLDWSWPVYFGVGKQGQDVKALVLISPKWSFPGIQLRNALAHPAVRSQLSVLIVVGGKGSSKEVGDAKRLYSILKPSHPDPPAAEAAEKQDLFYGRFDTKLQGTKMLGVAALNLERTIARFIELRLEKQDFPWRQRGG